MIKTQIYTPPSMRGNEIAAEAIKQEGKAGIEARERLAEEGRKAKSIPKPSGYHILIAIPKASSTFESGLAKADITQQIEEVGTVIGFVIDMGPDCYQDKTRYPTGPWCKKGDFVLIRAYGGTRFSIYGAEYRIINDDSVDGVVEDPRGVTRVGG